VLVEIVTASSFLDFGGIPDARYFHSLYDWRLSEAERDTGNRQSYKDRSLPRQLIADARKDISKDHPTEEQTFRGKKGIGKMLPKSAK
jgi:hypothetical protein